MSHERSFSSVQTFHTHTPAFFVTHHLFTYNFVTQLCFACRSSTTSFIFPSFPGPATTFGAKYWKTLPCGGIRSFNSPTAKLCYGVFSPRLAPVGSGAASTPGSGGFWCRYLVSFQRVPVQIPREVPEGSGGRYLLRLRRVRCGFRRVRCRYLVPERSGAGTR